MKPQVTGGKKGEIAVRDRNQPSTGSEPPAAAHLEMRREKQEHRCSLGASGKNHRCQHLILRFLVSFRKSEK